MIPCFIWRWINFFFRKSRGKGYLTFIKIFPQISISLSEIGFLSMTDYLILNSYCKVIFQEKIHIWSGQCNAFIYWIKYFLNLMYMNTTYFPTLYRYNFFFCLWEKYFKKIHPFPLLHKMIYFCKIQNAKSDIRLWQDPPFVLLILICINLLEIYI